MFLGFFFCFFPHWLGSVDRNVLNYSTGILDNRVSFQLTYCYLFILFFKKILQFCFRSLSFVSLSPARVLFMIGIYLSASRVLLKIAWGKSYVKVSDADPVEAGECTVIARRLPKSWRTSSRVDVTVAWIQFLIRYVHTQPSNPLVIGSMARSDRKAFM